MTDVAGGGTRQGLRGTFAHWNRVSQRIRSGIAGYSLSVVSVAAAVGSGVALQYYGFRPPPTAALSIAVAIATWYGGIGPAVLAVLLSIPCFVYFFAEPRYSFAISATELPYSLVFVAWALIVTWFSFVARQTEESLRQARDNLQLEVEQRREQARLLDQTHDSIFFRDVDGVISYWNRGAQELYGWNAEEAIGRRSHELLRTIFPAPIADIDAELRRTGVWEGELRHTKADGSQVISSSRWSLRRDDQGRPLVIMETNNDITERKHSEDEITRLNQELKERAADLESANKELESFAYSVSHDLRAPLRHVVGFSELLQARASSSLDEKSRHYVQTICSSARRMGDLVDDLLAFSRIGRAEARYGPVDLAQLAREVVAELRQDTKGREIVWRIGALPVCHGDRSMLRLVIVNLLSNAVKFTRMRQPAQIEIGCTERPQDVEIFVRDNGAGFDMRYVGKLFGVFQRLHPIEQFEGTGIGLATIQRIISRHGGTVRAEGAPDRGATFYFSLPRTTDRKEG
jgi:PAS domain S-box-containing protein